MTTGKKSESSRLLVRETPLKDRPLARRIFAANLKKAREDAQLSQGQVGELADLAQPYISEVERSLSNISLDNMEKLAEVVRRPLWKLLKPSDAFGAEIEPAKPAGRPAKAPARKSAMKRPRSKK